MQSQSAEYNVTRNYIEWLVDLPWSRSTPDQLEHGPAGGIPERVQHLRGPLVNHDLP